MKIPADISPGQLSTHSDVTPDSTASGTRDSGVFKTMRQERGLTQRAVAKGAGVTTNTVAKLERGETVTISTLFKVAEYLVSVPVNPVLVALLRSQG